MYTPLNSTRRHGSRAAVLAEPESLDLIHVRSNTGGLVKLSTFTHFANDQTALAVNHQGQFSS